MKTTPVVYIVPLCVCVWCGEIMKKEGSEARGVERGAGGERK